MTSSFKSGLLSMGFRLLFLIIIAKFIATVALFFLPTSGTTLSKRVSKTPPYQRVNVKNMIEQSKRVVKTEAVKTVDTSTQISDLVLKGLYYVAGNRGYIIVAKKSNSKKSAVIGVNEKFSGYTLVEILQESAIFERNGKRYTLEMSKRNRQAALKKAHYKPQPVEDENSEHQINRQQIQYYAKNYKQIWKDIAMREEKRDGKIIGFRVTRINPGTPFAELGLKKNDIIIKANNKEMHSYADAIKIYQDIDKIDAVEIVVLRNNQEKELVYEIF